MSTLLALLQANAAALASRPPEPEKKTGHVARGETLRAARHERFRDAMRKLPTPFRGTCEDLALALTYTPSALRSAISVLLAEGLLLRSGVVPRQGKGRDLMIYTWNFARDKHYPGTLDEKQKEAELVNQTL